MGLDITNALFGNFHLNWAATAWFGQWCSKSDLPNPFIGWKSGCNDGDPCVLSSNSKHVQLAENWCRALEQKFPDLAKQGNELVLHPPKELRSYLYPHK